MTDRDTQRGQIPCRGDPNLTQLSHKDSYFHFDRLEYLDRLVTLKYEKQYDKLGYKCYIGQ